jgi:hypothetical protein
LGYQFSSVDPKKRFSLLSKIGFGRRSKGGKKNVCPEQGRKLLSKQLLKPSQTIS